MNFIYHDWEYRDNKDLDKLVSVSVEDEKGEQSLWFQGEGREKAIGVFKSYYKTVQNRTWVCFSASADLSCLLAMGLELPLNVIDLMAESCNITLTHPEYYAPSKGLLAQLEAFGILSTIAGQVAKEEKNSARDLILNNTQYTPDQKARILAYGQGDTKYLSELLAKIMAVHAQYRTGVTVDDMLARGQFLKKNVTLEFKSRGIPVNRNMMDKVYNVAGKLREGLALGLNDSIGIEFFQWKGIKKDPKRDGLVFKYSAVEEFVKRLGIEDKWKKTDTGKLSTEDKYLREQSHFHPEIKELREVKQFMREVSDKPENDPRRLLKKFDGHWYTPTPNIPFAQKSSRTSPLPSKGFILNQSPWKRNAFIQVPKGHVFITVDYKGQETAIQAAVSGDENLKKMYQSPDIYLTMATNQGYIKTGWESDVDGAKKEYFLVRMIFKAMMLGLGFGLGEESLGVQMYLLHLKDPSRKITMTRGKIIAEELYDWHHQTFTDYWKWVERTWAMFQGSHQMTLPGGWVYFGSGDTRKTQIQNIPIQFRGARMIRAGVENAHDYGLKWFTCTLHDSLYALSPQKHAKREAGIIRRAMTDASLSTIGEFCPATLGATEIYTRKKNPYHDSRGDAILNKLKEMI